MLVHRLLYPDRDHLEIVQTKREKENINSKIQISIQSIDSIMISTTTGMANTTSTSTPIRPRPILASAFSFDSGYEISPFSNYSFQFGTESVPNTILTNNNNNSIMATNRLLNPIVQEDYEGIDDELISIDQHFTPIHSPATVENMANGQIDSSSSLMNCIQFNY